VTIQGDGRILVAGSGVLVRYNLDGRLDRSFGNAGRVRTRPILAGVVVANSGGKILLGGSARVPGGRQKYGFGLARYDRHGRLDRAFGRNGVVTTAFEDAREVAITALRLEPGGRLFAAGRASGERIAMARYTADGRLDRSFGTAGSLVAHFVRGGSVKAVALGRDGSIIAVGHASEDFALLRLRADGSRERSFGNDGAVSIDFGFDDIAATAAVAADGKVITFGYAAGECSVDPYPEECRVTGVGARLRRDGKLDRGFGRGGKVSLGLRFPDGRFRAIALTADGAIAVAGDTSPISRLLLALYRSDGRLDRRLAPSGVTETDFTNKGFTRSGNANAVAWDRMGRIVAAGDAAGQIAVARYRLRRS
jgi:uncharacterized delta-60 repeat protein